MNSFDFQTRMETEEFLATGKDPAATTDNQQPVAMETTNDCQWAALNNGHDYCDHAAPVRHYRESNTQPPAPVGTPDEATPRPWVVDNDSGIYYVVAPEIALVATLDPSDDDAPARANAHLIVQAVNTYTTNQQRIAELEAALREVRRIVQSSSTLEFGVLSYKVREIIDRAVLNRGGERWVK